MKNQNIVVVEPKKSKKTLFIAIGVLITIGILALLIQPVMAYMVRVGLEWDYQDTLSALNQSTDKGKAQMDELMKTNAKIQALKQAHCQAYKALLANKKLEGDKTSNVDPCLELAMNKPVTMTLSF